MRPLARVYCPDGDHARGFVLLEVMVAMVLLTTLLGALAAGMQRSRDAALDYRERAASLATGGSASDCDSAWSWGPMVEAAGWGPGPELCVTVRSGVGASGALGVWAGGWLLGEWKVTSGLELRLAAAMWQDLAGKDMVVRARAEEGGWGPPWRTVVPDAYGQTGPGASTLSAQELGLQGFNDAGTVSHARACNSALVRASWSGSVAFESDWGVVSFLPPHTQGVCRLTCGSREQTWVGDHMRMLDVYF